MSTLSFNFSLKNQDLYDLFQTELNSFQTEMKINNTSIDIKVMCFNLRFAQELKKCKQNKQPIIDFKQKLIELDIEYILIQEGCNCIEIEELLKNYKLAICSSWNNLTKTKVNDMIYNAKSPAWLPENEDDDLVNQIWIRNDIYKKCELIANGAIQISSSNKNIIVGVQDHNLKINIESNILAIRSLVYIVININGRILILSTSHLSGGGLEDYSAFHYLKNERDLQINNICAELNLLKKIFKNINIEPIIIFGGDLNASNNSQDALNAYNFYINTLFNSVLPTDETDINKILKIIFPQLQNEKEFLKENIINNQELIEIFKNYMANPREILNEWGKTVYPLNIRTSRWGPCVDTIMINTDQKFLFETFNIETTWFLSQKPEERNYNCISDHCALVSIINILS